MLGCARKIKRKNKSLLKYSTAKGSTLEGCRRTVTLPIKLNFTTIKDCLQHKVNISTLISS